MVTFVISQMFLDSFFSNNHQTLFRKLTMIVFSLGEYI